jgi:hypothetical protein
MPRRTRAADQLYDATLAAKSYEISCQKCVRWLLKSGANIAFGGDTLMHIIVAGSR